MTWKDNFELRKILEENQNIRVTDCVEILFVSPYLREKKGDLIVASLGRDDVETLYNKIHLEKGASYMFDITKYDEDEKRIFLLSKAHLKKIERERLHIMENIAGAHPLILQENEEAVECLKKIKRHELTWWRIKTLSISKKYIEAANLLRRSIESMVLDIQNLSDMLCDEVNDNYNYLSNHVNGIMVLN